MRFSMIRGCREEAAHTIAEEGVIFGDSIASKAIAILMRRCATRASGEWHIAPLPAELTHERGRVRHVQAGIK